MLSNIKIVLIQTFHPGNIGAAARAMKNMGLSQLVLVNPVDFPSDEATSRAGQATDLLENVQIVSSLKEAISDCSLVVATSARDRSIPLPALSAAAAGNKLVGEAQKAQVALVFGRERMGLHNTDIQQCHMQVNIDANPEYPVLNISQAIQILCYEIFQASGAGNIEHDESEYPLHRELELFYEHLEATLNDSGFINPAHPGQAMEHFRALYRKARPTKKELQLLRGSLTSFKKV